MKPTPLSAPSSHALASADQALDWRSIEAAMHRDPGARGLTSFRRGGVALDSGQLRASSLHLAEHASRVAIVTGFCIVLDDRVTAETDGPPGAIYLAQVLRSLGVEVMIVTDRYARPLVEAGCDRVGLPRDIVCEIPLGDTTNSAEAIDHWAARFLAQPWSHLIAIERPGPSHTVASLLAQTRSGAAPQTQFEELVPAADRDACHTMRGELIDWFTAPTHLLWDTIRVAHLPITTIGIGDGGNELGMGSYLWEDLVAAVGSDVAGRIACRVPADFALVAGTSNWGAYALALAVARLRELPVDIARLTPTGQEELLVALVAAGAVDGRTRRAEPTVDGLNSSDYLEPLAEMLTVVRASYPPT